MGICSICRHLHSKGISHGDLYGHNILVNRLQSIGSVGSVGSEMLPALLGDMGAASFYTVPSSPVCDDDGDVCGDSGIVPENRAGTHNIQLIEVRAFGCLIEELLDHCMTDTSTPTSNSHGEAVTVYETQLSGLRVLQYKCMDKILVDRPSFDDIYKELNNIFSI